MIIFGAGVVITTKSCPRKFASAAFQPWWTADFLLHVKNIIANKIHSWGPSKILEGESKYFMNIKPNLRVISC
jgi:hypothetical protein